MKTEYNKPVMWDGKTPLTGVWLLTYKIDGIRVFLDDTDTVVSRNGKPLYNMDHLKKEIKEAGKDGCEVFLGTFKATVEAVRTRLKYKPVPASALFRLGGKFDPRLDVQAMRDPSAGALWQAHKRAVSAGFEGLVAREVVGGRWLKIKKYETVDTTIIGFYEGKGKYKGMLGGFITKHGRVGTGITDLERRLWAGVPHGTSAWEQSARHPLYHTTVECKCMELTPAGKMRKPRFVRLRPDK